jgi:hypothetical protein
LEDVRLIMRTVSVPAIEQTHEAEQTKVSVAACPMRFQRRLRAWLVPIGVLVGTTTGVIARGWMRLITDDPDFSWAGTIFIVAAFAIAGVGHGIAWAARATTVRRRWSTVARVGGAVLTLPLFTGAGALMLPTVAAGSLARWRRDWVWPIRTLLAVIAAAAPVAVMVDVADHGVTAGRLLGVLLFALTYASIIVSMRSIVAPVDDGWRMPRLVRVALVLACVAGLLLIAVSVVGVVA